MKNENSPLFQSKLPGKKLLFPWVLTECSYNSCENEQYLNACSPWCVLVDSWPFVWAFNKMQKVSVGSMEHLLLAFLFPERLHSSWKDPSCSFDWGIHSTAGTSFLWNAAGIGISKTQTVIQMHLYSPCLR